ncbi:acyl CoA:acetate/3-ketoacid CoA transferase [Candidatus Halocynthiibacter alkanivorans]|uniref:acyl CoA:acetate/3-ketoacid CoA transferase n=1 Tax=Candidatus Halocynthiibacter alkanivorans TaxID=2267619 RepID=UPI000DF1C3FE|nr:CoA-transferase [Candidatus Halocynthiibacter alkanivorans]
MNKVIPAADAVELIQSNDVIAVSGYGTNGVPEKVLKALEERFNETHAPRDLTLMFAGGIGDAADRGLNRIGKEGLLSRVIGGHYGLIPKIEKLAVENKIAAYNFPEGVMVHLYRNIAAGKYGLNSHIGLETFVDPRLDGGKVNAAAVEDLVFLQNFDGDESLYFKGFPINVAIIRGTTADVNGNISLEKESLSLENLDLAMAARNSGGVVIVQVERIAQANSIDARDVRIPGFMVDCVVLAEPELHMQTYEAQYNPALSGELRVPLEEQKPMKFDERKIVVRRAAMELTQNAIVNLGVGLAASVGNVANEERIFDRIMLTVDPGIYGGVPLAGFGFGASLNYTASIDHAKQFDFIDGGGLDIACLGFAECDGTGNVNASRFAGRVTGCGGFINIAQNSKKVIFLGTFSSGGLRTCIEGGQLSIVSEGKHRKFVKSVSQVTFSGVRAAREGRTVLYVTERCVFRLSEEGLELTEIAPGIDMDRDILQHLPFRPVINTPKPMADVLFLNERMGLQRLISELSLEKRISYNPGTNMLFLDFSGMRLNTIKDVTRVRDAVEAVLKPLDQEVDAIVNYDGFWTNPEISEDYLDAVHYIQSRYYNKASRFTTNGFARIQLAKGLKAHQVHSGVVGNLAAARRSLGEV